MAEEASTGPESISVSIKFKDIKPLSLEFYQTETVNEVYQALEVLPQVHHITSFGITHQSKLLAKSTPLSDLVSSPNQTTLDFEIKPKAYNAKSINEHLLKVRDIVGLSADGSFGLNSGVTKINDLDLDPIADVIPKPEQLTDESTEEKEEDALAKIPEEVKAEAAQVVSEFYEKLPKNYFTPTPLVKSAVRALYSSVWNPVPFNWKSKGHLIYIYLQTLEGEVFHITGSTLGFFLNKSSNVKFDPTARETSHQSFNLYDLIAKVSKNFANQIKSNSVILGKVDPISFLKPQTGFLSNPWITKAQSPNADFGRSQVVELEQRDFNDEFQSIKEFQMNLLPERIVREHLLTKTSYEFTTKAVKGALAVINGEIDPIEPVENPKYQIYLRDNIFYSYGVDSSGFFADRGGDDASRAASNQDIAAIRFLNNLDVKGIYTLLTAIVDYAGHRVICQTPVPGLFSSSQPKEVKNEETGEIEEVEGDPLTNIDYGFDETSKIIKSDEEFVKDLKQIQKVLHFKSKKLDDGSEIVTNAEIKGMRGIDRRKYVIDLFNSTPLDIEFIEAHYNKGKESSYPHRQTVVRIEAVQYWWNQKVNELIEAESKKQGIDPNAELKEGEQPKEITVDDAKLQFTVDAFSSAGSEDANVRELSKYINSELIPRFLNQYDSVANLVPVDGAQLVYNLHKNGINVRYLGAIAKLLEEKIEQHLALESKAKEEFAKLNEVYEKKVEERQKKLELELQEKLEASKRGEEVNFNASEVEPLDNEEDEIDDAETVVKSVQFKGLLAVTIQELIARASKHILRSFASGLPTELLPSLISHYHNVLIGGSLNPEPKAVIANPEFYDSKQLSFKTLTPALVRSLIQKEVSIRYRYQLPENWWSTYVQPLQLQREIAGKFGIQWTEREYFYTRESYDSHLAAVSKEKKNKKVRDNSRVPAEVASQANVFHPDDVTVIPIIKDSIPRSRAGEQILEAGRQFASSTDEEKKTKGLALFSEAISVYEQVYGQIHPEVAKLYASLSPIYKEFGLFREATLFIRRAATINERVFGLDSHDTIVSLLNLAYLEEEGGNHVNSLKVYGRLIQIWHDIYNNNHVSIPTILANIIVVFQKLGLTKQSIELSEKLIKLSIEINGEESFGTGFLKFRLAYLLIQDQKFNEALKVAIACHNDLNNSVSHKHYLTKQARILVERLTKYKSIQEQNAKALKEREKQENAQKKTSSHRSRTPIVSNSEVSDMSVDEIMKFIDGSGRSKKNKNKKL